MTPYYEDEQSTIWLGDCREILPQLPAVDLVLTDPPYGVGLNTDNRRFRGGNNVKDRSAGSQNGKPIIGDEQPFDPTFLLHYGSNQVIWGWNHFPHLLPAGGCLVWLKRYDEAFGSFLSDAELAWVSNRRGVYCRRDLSNFAQTAARTHPTQKPLSLMRWCLGFFPQGNVLDPFMGSGTTLVAAKTLGRKAIGIEIDKTYCEVAIERLKQGMLPLTSPTPITPPQQGTLL